MWSLCMSGEPGRQGLLLIKFLVNLLARARDPANYRNRQVVVSLGTGASTGTAVASCPPRTVTATATASMNKAVRGYEGAAGRAALDPRTATAAPPPAPGPCSAPPRRRSAPHAT